MLFGEARGRAVHHADWTSGQLLLRFPLLPVTKVLLVEALMTGGRGPNAQGYWVLCSQMPLFLVSSPLGGLTGRNPWCTLPPGGS